MMRLFALLIVLLASTLSWGQRIHSPATKKDKYDNEIKENFKKLHFDWALTPAHQDLLNSGLESLGNGEWKQALEFFDKIIEFDSTFIPAYYFRFSSYEAGNKRTTAKAFNNLMLANVKVPKGSKDIYADLWDIYNAKHSERNRPLLELAPPFLNLSRYLIQHEQESKSESFTYLRQALSFLLIAEPAKAIILCDKSIDLQQSISALYLKAISFQILARHDSAFYLFDEIAKKDERVIESHENLALYKCQRGERISASKHLYLLNKIDPDSPNVWRFSGLLKVQIQDNYGAILDLTKYLKIDSTDFDCLKQRALAEFRVKNYDGSLIDLNSALKISDRDLDIFLYMSDTYLNAGDTIKAFKVLRDAEKIFSFNQNLDLFTANKFVEVNKPKKAQEIVDRVVRVVSLNHFNEQYLHQANVIQCKIYMRNSSPEKALDKLNDLISKGGEAFDYLFLRAEIYLMKGDKVHATTDLGKLIKGDYQPAIELYKTFQ